MITLNKYDSPIVACKNSSKWDQPSFMVIQAFDNMQYLNSLGIQYPGFRDFVFKAII